jgi:UDP-N-acetylmuramate: L-alanyl-gamma-D-glutamyl-meso-diaminopimelate ligase
VHYHAKTAVLNNLEYDHADIFPDIGAIETQFHHLVRTVPGVGRIVANGDEASIGRVLKRGCWSDKESFGAAEGVNWSLVEHPGGASFDVVFNGATQATVHWALTGKHNRYNALAAIAAARHVGVPVAQAAESLSRFQNVKRRMEVRGVVNGITVYDDFAHHPTAIATTVAGLHQKLGAKGRILAVLEPRSNTMKLGAMKDALPGSLKDADLVFGFGSQQALGWSLADALKPMGAIAHTFDQLDYMVQAIVQAAQPGDHILVMSNGGFGGIHQKLLQALAK